MDQLAFIHARLDRLANHRRSPESLQTLRQSPKARLVQVRGDAILMQGTEIFSPMTDDAGDCILLGRDAQHIVWFANQAGESEALRPLRSLMLEGGLSPEHLAILAQARSLVHWHESHGFCARCGEKSVMADAGYRRQCAACGSDHFPRTDPVVIMAVTHSGRQLLGRQKAWAEGMYSVLAGFMEPGETIEDAVRREVFEEAGIRLGAVRYHACQPWPFPSSLMIGVVAEALDDQLNIDHEELETARWFGAQEVESMLNNTHPQGLNASRPQAIAWHLVKAALQSQTA